MPTVSHCPRCQQHVTVPDDALPSARVRCPWCQAEYPLDETLPPRLIVVEGENEGPLWMESLEHAEPHPVDEAAAVVEHVPLSVVALRSRRPPKPWWRATFEAVAGALVGCLVAYYALALWLGPDLKKKGFPVFTSLPGITWMTTPAERSVLESGD